MMYALTLLGLGFFLLGLVWVVTYVFHENDEIERAGAAMLYLGAGLMFAVFLVGKI